MQRKDFVAIARCVVTLVGVVGVCDQNSDDDCSIIADCFLHVLQICTETTLELSTPGGCGFLDTLGLTSSPKNKNKINEGIPEGLLGALLFFWDKTRECVTCMQSPYLSRAMHSKNLTNSQLTSDVLHFLVTILQHTPLHTDVAYAGVTTLEHFLGSVEVASLSECGDFLQQAVLQGRLPHTPHTHPNILACRRIFHRTFVTLVCRCEVFSTDVLHRMMLQLCDKVTRGPWEDYLADYLGILEGCRTSELYLIVIEEIMNHYPHDAPPKYLWFKVCFAMTSFAHAEGGKIYHFSDENSATPYRLVRFVCKVLLKVMRDNLRLGTFTPRMGVVAARCLTNILNGRYVSVGVMAGAYHDHCIQMAYMTLLEGVACTSANIEEMMSHKKLATNLLTCIEQYFSMLGRFGAKYNVTPPNMLEACLKFVHHVAELLPMPFQGCDDAVLQTATMVTAHYSAWMAVNPEAVSQFLTGLFVTTVGLASLSSGSGRPRKVASVIQVMYDISECLPKEKVECLLRGVSVGDDVMTAAQAANITHIQTILGAAAATDDAMPESRMETLRKLHGLLK